MSKFNSNRYFNSKYLVIACIWAGYSFFTSCSPDSGIGANVLPVGTLNANFVDTATVQTSLVLEDTIPTNNSSTYLLGSYTDPIFGPTKASIYTQLILPNGDGANPFTANGNYNSTTTLNVILDSVTFSMPFGSGSTGGFYGTITPQTIQVYAVDQYPKAHFATDSAYYSDPVIADSTLLGESTVSPNMSLTDNVYYPTYSSIPAYTFSPRITVRLNQAWGQKWLNQGLSNTGDSALMSNAVFQRNLPGIYVTTSNPLQFPGQGGLWYMNPYINASGIIFYFRIVNPKTGGGTDTSYIITNFAINTSCVTLNHYDHDYSTSPFYGPHSKKDSVNSPNYAYIQGIGGVKTKIKFPYLLNWIKKGKIIVSRAEVDIPIVQSDEGIYAPPGQLYLIGINDTSTVPATSTYTLPDQYSPYYGGTYDAFNQMYVFNISGYIQEIFDKENVDAGLYLVAGAAAVNPNRVVTYGGAKLAGRGSNQRLRLKIYYTPLKS